MRGSNALAYWADLFRRVALGVDGDEEHLNLVGLVAQPFEHLFQLAQRGRADIRAVGVTEEDQHDLAFLLAQVEIAQVNLTGAARAGR